MTAKAAFQAFKRTVTVAWPEAQAAGAKEHLVRTAKAGHAKIMAEARTSRGAAPAFTAYANRPGNADLDSVMLPGPIVFEYFYGREIVEAALAALIEASPVRSGKYRDSHMLFVNGVRAERIPERFAASDEIMIANPVPYARRLEIGKTESGRDFLVSVPNRIYQRTVAKLRARYANLANVVFDYASLPGGYRLAADNLKKSRGTARPAADRAAGTQVRSPAIVIEALR